MGHNHLSLQSSYDAATVKMLCRAFDEACAGNYGHRSVDEERTRLALIVLQLGNNRARDIEDIKERAIAIMTLTDRLPAELNDARPRKLHS
jgi:hypothetical protein